MRNMRCHIFFKKLYSPLTSAAAVMKVMISHHYRFLSWSRPFLKSEGEIFFCGYSLKNGSHKIQEGCHSEQTVLEQEKASKGCRHCLKLTFPVIRKQRWKSEQNYRLKIFIFCSFCADFFSRAKYSEEWNVLMQYGMKKLPQSKEVAGYKRGHIFKICPNIWKLP